MDYITIPLSKTGKHAGKYEAIVSDEDKDLAELNWTVVLDVKRGIVGYPYRRIGGRKNPTIVYMHRVILEVSLSIKLDASQEVDHVNGNKLDNRRENLRVATRSQNNANQRKRKNNTSGYKGVSWHRVAKKWHARIAFNKTVISIGYFATPEEAHEAYKAKAIELHGEFANFNKEK